MKIFCSLSAKGFFISGVNQIIPADACEIAVDIYNELIAGECSGEFQIDWSGNPPALIPRQVQTGDEITTSPGQDINPMEELAS
ncbi:hypothetical protein NOX36_001865 [Citrobacter freundii]|nr:hypothetical protein [Citrobacter freundii]